MQALAVGRDSSAPILPETGADAARSRGETNALETQLACPLQDGGTSDRNGSRRTQAFHDLRNQFLLFIVVVVTGSGNSITKQMVAVPMKRFEYMLSLADAVMYIPVYGAILLTLMRVGVVSKHQIHFMWHWHDRKLGPYVLLIAAAGFGSAAGDVIGMICTPYVVGPLHSLLSNTTSIFIAAMSLCLGQRYSLLQLLSLLGVLCAVALAVLSAASQGRKDRNRTDLLDAVLLAFSCAGNALSFVVKEFLFRRYERYAASKQLFSESLNVFVVNTHEAFVQLPFTLLLVPLNEAFKQTNGEGVFVYLKEASTCIFSSEQGSCGSESKHEEWAGPLVAVYLVFNLTMNISILMLVKYGGAMVTFVALKAIFPVSMVLFAYVDWPFLGSSPIHWLMWVALAGILPSIAVYQWATVQQARRAAVHPSRATCCWPCGASPAP